MNDFTKYYDDIWVNRDEYFRIHRNRFIQSWDFIRNKCNDVSQVLDIGGVGPLAAFLALTRGCVVTQTSTDLRFPLNLPSEHFDFIICTETIEHIKDVESSSVTDLDRFNYSGVQTMLQEIRRMCRPSGQVFISTPNANSYITLMKWLNGENLLFDPNHVREFSVKDLQRVCMAAGLTQAKLEVVDSWRHHFGDPLEMLRVHMNGLAQLSAYPRGDNIMALFRR